MSDSSPPSSSPQDAGDTVEGRDGASPASGEERRGYGIGTVSRLTGISTHTLRVWERRYGAVDAERSDSGRRLYSRPDIERLTVMKHLVDRGEPIGHVARLSHTELQERLAAYEQHVAKREQLSSAPTRTALLGETFRLMNLADFAGLNVVSRGAELGAFRADVKRLRPEALVVEQPTVDQDTRVLLSDLRRLSGASRVVLVYNFARSNDLQSLADEWTVLLRSPVTGADLMRALRDVGGAAPVARPAAAVVSPQFPIEATGEIPPRMYTREQLARMASQSTTVECECPKHLVDLVVSLTAFESYSANCESRNPTDAALHAYLHETTARARECIEYALRRVVIAEGIDVDGDGNSSS